jgi:hypothetical protein
MPLSRRFVLLTTLLVGPLTLVGCSRPPASRLTVSNDRQKFDEVEAASRTTPETVTAGAVEQILGPGESVPASHPDIAGGPPGTGDGVHRWSRWAFADEVLLVGYVNDTAASVVRLRR